MKPAAQVTCPNCQNSLRIPPDAVDVSLKCKNCGYILQIKKKAAKAQAAPVAATAKAAPTAPAKSLPSDRRAPQPLPEDDLPDFTPPSPVDTPPPPKSQRPPKKAPAPIVEELPAAAPTDYNPAFEPAGRKYTGRGAYKGPRGGGAKAKWIAVGVIVFAGAGLLAAILAKPEWFKGKPGESKEAAAGKEKDGKELALNTGPGTNPKVTGKDGEGAKPVAAGPTGHFPRRMLAVGLSNYPYLNPIQYGLSKVEKESERRDFYKVFERLAASWKVPKDQVFFVTDGPQEGSRSDAKHPPVKMVITGAVEKFLATCRPQDRIVLAFAGHALEKDGEAYLAPLEGDLDEPESLIKLKDVYAQLAKCPAQEKLVIFDVCRFDPGRGVERPGVAEMSEALEKALHDSPEGVSVWTSCSAGQYAYEYEYSEVDMRGLRRYEMYGSIFLNMFVASELRPKRDKNAKAPPLAQPGDPLPLAPLAEYVNEMTNTVVQDLEKKDQKPKLTLKTRDKWLAYDAKEPPAKRFDLPTPPPTARRELVVSMFNELRLPPLKALARDEEKGPSLADNFFFTEAQLKDYVDEGPTFEDVQKAPEKYAKDYPLRVATVEALVEMRKLKQENAKDELPERFNGPTIPDAEKKKITDKYQRIITDRQSTLDEQREKLEAAGKKKEMEKSKHWLANYEYAYAQTRIRFAYIAEYNLAMGKVKLEQLPELDPKAGHKGWKLASTEKMISPKDIRDMAEEGKTALAELAKEHPNTPWAVVAKTQKHITLGLQWQASSFEAEK
jgi:hypothetical protein